MSEAPLSPASSAAPANPEISIATLNARDPWQWLKRGWADLWAHKAISLFYGVCFAGMAIVLGVMFQNRPEYVMSLVSGCFLIGPFLAMGLYDVSRRVERGEAVAFWASLTCWRPHLRSMGLLVLVLTVLELIWGRASLVVFAVFFNTGMPTTASVVQAVFNPENWEFILVYTLVGGVFAALVFSTCAVSVPMILDRDTDAITAAISSLQVVFGNLLVMLQWGVWIMVLTGVALLPWGLGLVVVGPWLGYASWHAYRRAVVSQ